MRNASLVLSVMVSGAAVLALEILGTRILGPFYGVSLYLWSALITVTLAALSVGYAVGGQWADRGARPERLALLMGAAGGWCLLIPWLRTPLLHLTEPLGLRAAVLVAALVMFGPPLTLLGMVSPTAIRLKADRLEQVGRTAGNLSALSTLASVAAALLTGFWLIPHIGVTWLTWLVALALLLCALLVLSLQGRRRASAVTVGLLVLAAGLTRLAPGARARPDRGLMEIVQSPYGEIRVVDQDNKRHLVLDGSIQSMVEPGTWYCVHRHVPVIGLARAFFDDPGKLLVIGLGGGSVSKDFAQEHWQVDAVEINPSIVTVARRDFGLYPSDAHIFTTDGRRYLQSTTERYNVIVLDAYGGASIPFHLVTAEAFALVAARLAPGGIVALNLETLGWDDPLLYSIAATLHTQFSHVIALPTSEPPNIVGNQILLASNRPLDLPDDKLVHPKDVVDDPDAHFVAVHRFHAWNNQFDPLSKPAPILTDDRNPVDIWTERINLAARRGLHDYFKPSGMSW